MTGSGKTWGALDMLSRRSFDRMAWVIIDHKRDANIKRLPAEELTLNPVFLPDRGLHVVHASIKREDKEALEGLLERIFKKGRIGVYIDEGHLLGPSEAVRMMLVAGRSNKTPIMWTSQRANWIDSFVWSQSTFYRVFRLQTWKDIRAVQENWPTKYEPPEEYHSWYFDGKSGRVHYLLPADNIENTIKRLDEKLLHTYRMI
jgi:hypothetical protein